MREQIICQLGETDEKGAYAPTGKCRTCADTIHCVHHILLTETCFYPGAEVLRLARNAAAEITIGTMPNSDLASREPLHGPRVLASLG